jgi:hypothetical protein
MRIIIINDGVSAMPEIQLSLETRNGSVELRSLPTRDGCFLVPWDLHALQSLLRSRPLEAEEFATDHPSFHRFLRDLFALSAQERLVAQRDGVVTRLARDLMRKAQSATRPQPSWEAAHAV